MEGMVPTHKHSNVGICEFPIRDKGEKVSNSLFSPHRVLFWMAGRRVECSAKGKAAFFSFFFSFFYGQNTPK